MVIRIIFEGEVMKQQNKRHESKSARCALKKPSRRQFLKQSSRLLAGSVVTGVALPRIYAAQDHTIRLALVGCGGRGTGAVADAFSAKGGPVKLFAMADLFQPRLQSSLSNLQKDFADKLDVPPERRFIGFDAYRKAIDCLSPGDVVLLTTHAAFRPLHFEYAVTKGINVFAEKSFATDAPASVSCGGIRRPGRKPSVGFTMGQLEIYTHCVFIACMARSIVRRCPKT
jgi:hypothetical protein